MRSGRPFNQPTISLPEWESIVHDATLLLTDVQSLLHHSRMARASELTEALMQRLRDDGKALDDIYRKQRELRSAYNQFRDTIEQERTVRQRVLRTVALLGDSISSADLADVTSDELATLANTNVLRSTVPLWEMVAEVLSETGETRVYELERALAQYNLHISRQALESALRTHPKVFRVRKEKREKYVSLRKESNAATPPVARRANEESR